MKDKKASCYRKENLLHIHVCLCTLQEFFHSKYNEVTFLLNDNVIIKQALLTVSKNLTPYSSARA